MPYPSQFSREQLIQVASTLFDEQGYEAVSMAQVAEALGVKASSLYKHVSDKAALLSEVNTLTLHHLTETLHASVQADSTPYEQCLMMGRAYWQFAHAHPRLYELAFMQHYNATSDTDVNEHLGLPIQAILIHILADEALALVALRGAWAFLHGFVSLSMGQHFRRSGNLDYERAWQAYLAGWGIVP